MRSRNTRSRNTRSRNTRSRNTEKRVGGSGGRGLVPPAVGKEADRSPRRMRWSGEYGRPLSTARVVWLRLRRARLILTFSGIVFNLATGFSRTTIWLSNNSPLFYVILAVMMAPLGHFFWRYWCNVESGDWPFYCQNCRGNMRPHSLVAATLNCPRCGKQALIDDS